MIAASQVACVLPTKGDVDLKPLLEHLPFDEIATWDNSSGEDLGVYGRYAAIERVSAPVIFTLDDDTLIPSASVYMLLAAYEPGVAVCNVPADFRERYTDSALVGFGAVFDRDLPRQAFERYWARRPDAKAASESKRYTGRMFRRTCDLVFTMLTPTKFVDVPIEMLPRTFDPDRMSAQPGHYEERERMRELCRWIRDRETAAC